MREKYNLDNALGVIKNPDKIPQMFQYIREDTSEIAHCSLDRVYYSYNYKQHEEDIIEKDWDNLILLDACRYDVLESLCDEEVQKVVSVSGRSSEFIEETMNGKELFDTVYISSNPHVERTLEDGVFHDVIKTYGETWTHERNQDHTKFHPENVYNIATSSIEDYPDKRIIVHFMQPHGPYFGSKAKDHRERLKSEHNLRFTRLSDDIATDQTQYADLMYAAKDGYLSAEQVREVYIENLEIVLEYARELSQRLEGKTVISSDHGEKLGSPSALFGPRYGHNGYAPEVRFVPWLELNYDGRKEVASEQPIEAESVDESTVTEQLEHLGYL